MQSRRARLLATVFGAAMLLSGCGDKAGKTAAVPGMGMVLIPAGEFVMGSDKTDEEGLQNEYGIIDPPFMDEHPMRKVFLADFMIDQYEVTNAQYKTFVQATEHPVPAAWVQNGYSARDGKLRSFDLDLLRRVAVDYFKLDRDTTVMGREELLVELDMIQTSRGSLPVASVSWHDAHKYCAWAGKRLPSEAEWEKAARGPQGLEYPWGNEFDLKKTNSGQNSDEENDIASVGSYPADKSPYGVYDMAGNVSEWVDDWYQSYPGGDYHSPFYGEIHKVVRGGNADTGHYALSLFFRAALRHHMDPILVIGKRGFRCAK